MTRREIQRILIGAGIGLIPGVGILFSEKSIGLSLMLAGGIVGALVALEEVNFRRFLFLVAFAMIGRFISPFVGKSERERENTDLNQRLIQWLFPESKGSHFSNWQIFAGTVFGVVIGIGLGEFDLWRIQQERLPCFIDGVESTASVTEQVVYLSWSMANFGGMIAIVLWNRKYHKAINFAAVFSLLMVLVICIPSGVNSTSLLGAANIFFSTCISIVCIVNVCSDEDAISKTK